MHEKRLPPILQKVSRLPKMSIFVAKMRMKPIIARLVLLKRSSRKLKIRFKLLKHFNNDKISSGSYRFLEEYQFSASSTPLIDNNNKKQQLRRIFQQEFFFLSRCFNGGLKSTGGGRRRRSSEAPVGYSLAMERYVHGVPAGDQKALEPLDLNDHHDDVDVEEDSVDQRAARFIEWFYQEMRLQRQ